MAAQPVLRPAHSPPHQEKDRRLSDAPNQTGDAAALSCRVPYIIQEHESREHNTHFARPPQERGQTAVGSLPQALLRPGPGGSGDHRLRTAEGAGADGIILNRASVDLYNPKTIRSTMGSVYRMPFLYVEEIEEILPELKRRNIRTYAAHLKGKNCYDEEDYRTGTAFFIGNEGNGLSERLSRMADVRIRIPMEGSLESLNAAVAASILMYEVNRQRRS